ncbi:hypothetical protein LUZ60_015263 [Juncus effusus]|nr:hypothetical protein LUZ60_015263 [Juncus effusus]
MNTSQFMDKQILDLMNHPPKEETSPKSNGQSTDPILPSYDFQPIRSVPSSSSPPSTTTILNPPGGSSSPPSTWGSLDSRIDSRTGSSNLRTAGVTLEPQATAGGSASIAEIERTVKKHVDTVLSALEGVSARLAQLESRTCHVETAVDGLRAVVGDYNGSNEGKLRHFENILREVQAGVQVLRDKQEIVETQLHLSKFQPPSKPSSEPDSSSQHQQQQQQLALPAPPNAPPPPAPPQYGAPPQMPPQSLPNAPPQYGAPPPMPSQSAPNAPPPPQYGPPPPPPPQQQSYFPSQPEPAHQQPPPSSYRPSSQVGFQPPPNAPSQYPPYQPQPDETSPNPPPPYNMQQQPSGPPTQTYPPRGPMPPSNPPPPYMQQQQQPNLGPSPPSSSFYGPPPPIYNEPQNRPTAYGPPPIDPYSYSSGSPSYRSKPNSSSPFAPSNNPLPTAKVLPQANPIGSQSSGNNNSNNNNNNSRVPLDDVVEKVAMMGFSREQVRATVRRLTENGQNVDLNVVLDKLMNDADVIQPQKGWFNR